jgi:hypothetical protein
VPWCDDCSRWFSPNALSGVGECPKCGEVIDDPSEHVSGADGEAVPKIPWHFWLLLGSAGIYLTWRAVQGVAWLVG